MGTERCESKASWALQVILGPISAGELGSARLWISGYCQVSDGVWLEIQTGVLSDKEEKASIDFDVFQKHEYKT